MTENMSTLTYENLKTAIAGSDAAVRIVTRLQPAGGPGSKVFPPTHSGGVYAWEMRRIGKEEVVKTVLLDSVQSQANRMEQALLEAYRANKIRLPLIEVDFGNHFADIGPITTLDAPHRIADAIFRESLLGGQKFRESDIGKAFANANIRNATALYQYCPHALVFGVWDSTGSEGGLGNKFQRVVTSEIIGVNAEKGVKTSSRIDPAVRRNPEIYKAGNGSWTADPELAERDSNGKPLKYEKELSKLNFGNIPPDFGRYDPKKDKSPLRTMYEEIRVGDVLPGGVTISEAVQTTVLSFPALRRLRFPLDGKAVPESDNAARTVLAALALAAIAHLREQGHDLRSRCLLIPEGEAEYELIANNGKVEKFTLNAEAADKLFQQAVQDAKSAKLPWEEKKVQLTPEDRLIEVVRRSRQTTAGEG